MTFEPIEEQLVFFPCGETTLAGILAIPMEPNGRTVVIPWGSGTFPSSGRNRIRARLARTLATDGFHTFRFDYRGVGESEGDYVKPHLAKPNTDEIIAACAWLTSQGLSQVVLVANCFGGWSALMAAPSIPGLKGVAVVNSPVRRDHRQVRGTWRWWASRLKKVRLGKLRSAKHRAAYRKLVTNKASSLLRHRSRTDSTGSDESGSRRSFSEAVHYLLDNGIPLLLVYGDGDFRSDLESELDNGLRKAIERVGSPTRLVTVVGRLGDLASLAAQDELLDGVIPWPRELEKLPD
jgi:pimeloyl-ACP methyl ester carboxylesterase